MSSDTDLERWAVRVGTLLERSAMRMATAESCTGGGIAHTITAIAGSSAWFDRGFVTYSNASKTEMLGVPPEVIEKFGAVSEEVVVAMTAGALAHASADWVVAVSGIAGPGGGSADKPVGTVWLAWQKRGERPRTECAHFDGDREGVRKQAVSRALEVLARELNVPKIHPVQD